MDGCMGVKAVTRIAFTKQFFSAVNYKKWIRENMGKAKVHSTKWFLKFNFCEKNTKKTLLWCSQWSLCQTNKLVSCNPWNMSSQNCCLGVTLHLWKSVLDSWDQCIISKVINFDSKGIYSPINKRWVVVVVVVVVV